MALTPSPRAGDRDADGKGTRTADRAGSPRRLAGQYLPDHRSADAEAAALIRQARRLLEVALDAAFQTWTEIDLEDTGLVVVAMSILDSTDGMASLTRDRRVDLPPAFADAGPEGEWWRAMVLETVRMAVRDGAVPGT